MLDLLLPRRCVICGSGGATVCTSCLAALQAIEAPLCERCGSPTAWPVRRCAECAGRRLGFIRARAAIAYDDRARAFVAGWKEGGLRTLGRLAAEIVVKGIPPPAVDALAFVPSDPERGYKRGHHPAERLARELAGAWELPLEAFLRRNTSVPRQRGLRLEERRKNVRGAFGPAGEAPRRVCLVDDVYTSGATAAAASSALRKAGARSVEVVTFARAIRLR